MCGIPMQAPVYAAKKEKLTLEQAMTHVGGEENLISSEGRAAIKRKIPQYIWQYPDKRAWCTACGGELRDLKQKHGAMIICPLCGFRAEFRHEARGHKSKYDQLFYYEYKKSVIDAEAVVLTATHVWRNSGFDNPHQAQLHVEPCALYIFRVGKAVTVYKRNGWGHRRWNSVDSVHPEHTKYGNGGMNARAEWDYMNFKKAIAGTQIGRVYDLCQGEHENWAPPVVALANCARRPWLEYLAKCGQARLMWQLLKMAHVSRKLVPKPKSKRPDALLGLTEGQWFEVRRDGTQLTVEILKRLSILRRMGFGDWHMQDVLAIKASDYNLELVAPSEEPPGPDAPHYRLTVGDMLARAEAPEKLRRKVYRRILRAGEDAGVWHDYYRALMRLGEDMTDPRLLLPKDVHAMHDRMYERIRVIEAEKRAKHEEARRRALDAKYADFKARRLPELYKRYSFQACGLVLRPYESAREVVAEGKALKICIGGYAERYLAGGTVICCLRRAEEPDEPWRAVEFTKEGVLVQDRGFANDRVKGEERIDPGTRAQLRNFWAAWNRAHKKQQRARVSV